MGSLLQGFGFAGGNMCNIDLVGIRGTEMGTGLRDRAFRRTFGGRRQALMV